MVFDGRSFGPPNGSARRQLRDAEPPRPINYSERARQQRYERDLARKQNQELELARGPPADDALAQKKVDTWGDGEIKGLRATVTSHERIKSGRPANTRKPRFVYSTGGENEQQGHGARRPMPSYVVDLRELARALLRYDM